MLPVQNDLALCPQYLEPYVNLLVDIVCEYPGKPRYGDIDGEFPAKFGSVVSYSCSDGFALLGESELVCHQDGVWTGQKPECKRT